MIVARLDGSLQKSQITLHRKLVEGWGIMNEAPKFKSGDFVFFHDPYSRTLKRLLVIKYKEGYGRYKTIDVEREEIIEPLVEDCFATAKEYYEAMLQVERRKLSEAMSNFNRNTKYYKEKLKAC